MIPYGRQDISQADIDSIIAVLKSDWLTQGPLVPKFEEILSKQVGAKFGVAVNSATSALHIACLALDLGPGDWVWTSPNTFVASANCALYCGAQIDFVDIDSKTYNIDVGLLNEKLKIAANKNCLPKIVIPVHYAGQPCDMVEIYNLSRIYGFKIIEDASHAIGASYQGVKVGSCIHSDITVFSFHPVKIITAGEGGMAVSNDINLVEKMLLYRNHGITNNHELMLSRPAGEIWNYQQIELGFNYRMTDIQAALGISQLSRIDEFLKKRHEIANIYNSALDQLQIIIPYQQPNYFSSYHLYPIRIKSKIIGKNQLNTYLELRSKGVGVNLHYIPVHRHPFYERLGFFNGQFPESESLHREILSLPIHNKLSYEEVNYVVKTLRSFFN